MNKSARGQVPAVSTSPKTDQRTEAARSRNQKKEEVITDKQEGATVGKTNAQEKQRDDETFKKVYDKELRVSKDEIPIILNELNDSAYQFIKKEQYERALNLLQKAYGIMDTVDFTVCRRDKFHLFVMFHNMALCYQKMQMLEESASCIDQALQQIPYESINLQEKSISNRMRKLSIVSHLRMQFCAILSQIHRHKDALGQAKESVKLSHLVINDLRELCLFYINREDFSQMVPTTIKKEKIGINDIDKSYQSVDSSKVQDRSLRSNRNRSFSSFLSQQEAYGASDSFVAPQTKPGLRRQNSYSSLSSFASANQMESSMSYIEKTARKLYPILKELKKRMIPEKRRQKSKTIYVNDGDESDDLIVDLANERSFSIKNQVTDMKNILGYLNQNEWTSKLSIGSIMQLQPFKIKDLLEEGQNELELTRESFIQKVSLLVVSYFCYSTEIRFIIQLKEDLLFDSPVKQKESEYWHSKALEVTCTFLPGECPLLNHIHVSYQKHFAPVKNVIQENQNQDDKLMVVKPLNGVENIKLQPIIRKINDVKFAITPYQMTPLNKMTNQVLGQMISFNEYSEGHSQVVQGPTIKSSQILGKVKATQEEEDDMTKLQKIFNKLMSQGKHNRNDLIQKLIKISDQNLDLSVRSQQVIDSLTIFQLDVQDFTDDNTSQLSRVAKENQFYNLKSINSSDNWHKSNKLRTNAIEDRPQSANGKVRNQLKVEAKHNNNIANTKETTGIDKAVMSNVQSQTQENFGNKMSKFQKPDLKKQPQQSLNKLSLGTNSPLLMQQPNSRTPNEAQIQKQKTVSNGAGFKDKNSLGYEELKLRVLAEQKKLSNKSTEEPETVKSGGNLNVYKPTFIINNNIQNDSKLAPNLGIVKQRHDQLQQQATVKKTIQQQQIVYEQKTKTPDEAQSRKQVKLVLETPNGKPQKGSKLANQSQAQYLTQNAKVITASGGHSISINIAAQDYLLAYKTAKPVSATSAKRSNSALELAQKIQSDVLRSQVLQKPKQSVKRK